MIKEIIREIELFDVTHQEWIRQSFTSISAGDVFRIFDNGQRYADIGTGNNIWIASSDAYLNDGIYQVDTLY